MTPEQIAILLRLLEKIADRPFTITQATDWSMLAVLISVLGGILVVATGFFWRDVGKKFEQMERMLKESKIEDTMEHSEIWTAYEKCQERCCPHRPGSVK